MSNEPIPSPLSPEDIVEKPRNEIPLSQDDIVNASKARDEKCMPIAQGVLEDMAEVMMPLGEETADFNPLLMKTLQRFLDADTNVHMENSYIFQLLLGALSGMGTIIQECAVVPNDDARYGAIGKKMLGILAKSQVKMGTLTPDELKTSFASVKQEFDVLFAEEKLTWLEIKYVSESIFAAFKIFQQTFAEAVEMSIQQMEAKILGLEYMSDLSMKKLDETLQKPTVSPETPK